MFQPPDEGEQRHRRRRFHWGAGHRPHWNWQGHLPHPRGESTPDFRFEGHDFFAKSPFNDPAWHERRREHARGWQKRGRRLFFLFAMVFGVMALLVVGGMGILALLFSYLVDGTGQVTLLVWIGGCGLSMMLPMVAMRVARHGFRDIARPLGEVMSAADAVAEGDLSVRVPERKGEFGKLSLSFNRMVSELERSEQQRRSLTADVAHELRTPLHILQGNLEGLIDGVYQPTPDHLHMMLDETRLIARLVDDLRVLSLAESGHLPLHIEDVPAADLLADVATSFSAPAESAGIALRVEAQSLNGHAILVDPMRINQVLGNLVANALRYTPAGGMITLSGAPVEGGVRLKVSDTGSGIAPDDLPHIFDRFWKADKSRSREGGGGSGLGLAIARQLVHLHGGQIAAQSQPDRGTVFTIDLPNEVRSEQPIDLQT